MESVCSDEWRKNRCRFLGAYEVGAAELSVDVWRGASAAVGGVSTLSYTVRLTDPRSVGMYRKYGVNIGCSSSFLYMIDSNALFADFEDMVYSLISREDAIIFPAFM